MSSFKVELRGGWRNLIAATVGICVGVGAYVPLSSLFFRALEHEFGWTKAVVAVSLVALPVSSLMLPIVGWLVDRYGVRWPAAGSVLAQVLSYVCLAHLDGSPRQFYLAILALNVLGCGASPITYTRLIVSDFRASRGTALSISLAGIAFAAMLFPQIIGPIIETTGWRDAYLTLAMLALGGGGLAFVLMRPPLPANAAPGRSALQEDGLSLREAIAKRAFWILGLSILAIGVASFGLLSQFQSLFVEKGLASRDAIWLLSLMSASVFVSRLIVGRLLDRPSPAKWAAAVLVLSGFGPLLMLVGHGNSLTAASAVILLGFSVGAEFDLVSFFCGRIFGLRRYTAIYGLLLMFYFWGTSIGGVSYAYIHDRLGAYDPVMMLSALLLFASAAGIFLIDRESWSYDKRSFIDAHPAKF